MEFAAPSRPTEPSSKRTERTDLRKRSPRHRPQRITSRKLSLGTSNASSTEKREQKPKLSPTTPPPSYSHHQISMPLRKRKWILTIPPKIYPANHFLSSSVHSKELICQQVQYLPVLLPNILTIAKVLITI